MSASEQEQFEKEKIAGGSLHRDCFDENGVLEPPQSAAERESEAAYIDSQRERLGLPPPPSD